MRNQSSLLLMENSGFKEKVKKQNRTSFSKIINIGLSRSMKLKYLLYDKFCNHSEGVFCVPFFCADGLFRKGNRKFQIFILICDRSWTFNYYFFEVITVCWINLRLLKVMTENLFRFEHSTSKKFENRPTISVVNRAMTNPVKDFKSFEQDGKLVILTSKFNITYVVGSGLKSAEDLR